MSTQIEKLIKRYEEKQPEIVFEWKDSETDAEGWVVINSLRGGAAGGGTTPITDIKKLNAWDLLEKFFRDKKDPKEDKDPLDKYT